jgi:hypothetical protein
LEPFGNLMDVGTLGEKSLPTPITPKNKIGYI